MEMNILFQIQDLKQMGIVLKQIQFMNFTEITGTEILMFIIVIKLIKQQNAHLENCINLP
jgi:hypothetical protein